MTIDRDRDDRCAHDVPEGSHWHVRECRQTAAAIEADLAEIGALVRTKLTAWADKGWLEREYRVWMGPHLNSTKAVRGKEAAIERVTQMIRESLLDELSLNAREAREVAQ